MKQISDSSIAAYSKSVRRFGVRAYYRHLLSAVSRRCLRNPRSNRQFRVALDHALLQFRAFVRAPSLGAVRDAVAERASIGRGRALRSGVGCHGKAFGSRGRLGRWNRKSLEVMA